MWHRYIDNIFIVWDASRQLLDDFKQLGIKTFNLAFTMSCSSEHIFFLDIWIKKDEGGALSSGLFRKPTSGNTLSHASSPHPGLWWRVFPTHNISGCAGIVPPRTISNRRRMPYELDSWSEAILKNVSKDLSTGHFKRAEIRCFFRHQNVHPSTALI